MNMKSIASSLILAAALASSAAAFAQTPAPATATVKLNAQNNSGETGTVVLTQAGADVTVNAHITGAGDTPQPIHIHKGSCAKLDPAPTYPLTTVQNGSSVTTLKNMQLSQLETGAYAINVHKSTSDIPTYVACGDIPKAGT
jgi:opacity protein-like surface antigen